MKKYRSAQLCQTQCCSQADRARKKRHEESWACVRSVLLTKSKDGNWQTCVYLYVSVCESHRKLPHPPSPPQLGCLSVLSSVHSLFYDLQTLEVFFFQNFYCPLYCLAKKKLYHQSFCFVQIHSLSIKNNVTLLIYFYDEFTIFLI